MNKHKGSSLDSFLEEEGLLDEVEAIAVKRVVAYEIEQVLKKANISKSEFAKKMLTSRSGLDRLLDENNTSVTLKTLVRVAHVLGKQINVSFSEFNK